MPSRNFSAIFRAWERSPRFATDQKNTRLAVETASTDEDLLGFVRLHVSRITFIKAEDAACRRPVAAPTSVNLRAGNQRAQGRVLDFSMGARRPGGGTRRGGQGCARAPRRPARRTLRPNLRRRPIRVAISKVDRLINLVGELVITQAMLAQNSRTLDPAVYQQLLSAWQTLIAIRGFVKSRSCHPHDPHVHRVQPFPCMLRDLASVGERKWIFVTQGEGKPSWTRDWSRRLPDPLTHLVRNSCDHGIESPADRVAAGKSETERSPCRPPIRVVPS